MTQQQRRSSSNGAGRSSSRAGSSNGSGNGSSNGSSSGSGNGHRSAGPAKRSARPSPAALAGRASAELSELLGRDPEGIVSLERTDDGWRVGVEFVEIRRIPDTADVMAEYEVDADSRGHLVGYRRVRRYSRGSVQDD